VGSSAVLYFDGVLSPVSCKIGGVLKRLGEEDVEYSDPLPNCTCNEAEYHALIRGLKLATDLGVTDLSVFGDSMLVVMQVRGSGSARRRTSRPSSPTSPAPTPSSSTLVRASPRRPRAQHPGGRAHPLTLPGFSRRPSCPNNRAMAIYTGPDGKEYDCEQLAEGQVFESGTTAAEG
jgi:ribonuclease HI